MNTHKLERALWLADQIDQMSKELEQIKNEIRSTHQESTVIDLGYKGHIVVTVPDPVWVLRKGKTLTDCIRTIGGYHTGEVFSVSETVNVNQEAVNKVAKTDPQMVDNLVKLLDQRTHTTRIGFRPGQVVGNE
jgi:hypothetical protein